MGKVPVLSSLSKRHYHRPLVKSIVNLTQQWSLIINFFSKNSPVVQSLYQHMLDSLESQQSWDTRNLAMSSFSQLSGDEELSSLSLCPELRSQSLPPVLALGWHSTTLCLWSWRSSQMSLVFLTFSFSERDITSGRLVSMQRKSQIADWERKPHGRLIALLRSLTME